MLRSILSTLSCVSGRGRVTEREPFALGTLSPISSDEDEFHKRDSARHHLDDARALLAAFLSMVAIGHAQYTWTLFVESYQNALRTNEAGVQVAFSCFVMLQTTSVLLLGLAFGNASRANERAAMAGDTSLYESRTTSTTPATSSPPEGRARP